MRALSLFGLLMILFFGILGCTNEEDQSPPIVVTEQLLFVGAEQVRASGRLITNREITAIEHGFEVATEPSFGNSVKVSLGEKNQPGRFIGELDGLSINTAYYIRAFAVVEGEELLGDPVPFETLDPQASTFAPTFGRAGQTLTIFGVNLSASTRVFFGDQEAQIVRNSFESRLSVLVPQAAGEVRVPVRIQVQDKVISLGEFEYQAGKYTKITEVPDGLRIYHTVSFLKGNSFFFGLGQIRNAGLFQAFQRYDLLENRWQEVIFPGSGRISAFGTESYIGGGAVETGRDEFVADRTFWKQASGGFQQLTDLPFQSRESLVFEFGGSLYVLGGQDGFATRVFRYETVSAVWTELPQAPISLNSNFSHFVYQGSVFVVTTVGTIFQFFPESGQWTYRGDFPGNRGQSINPVAQVLGNKAYIGLFRRSSEMWELNLDTWEWKLKNEIPGFPQSINAGAFTWNGAVYILRGPEISVFGNIPFELYRFEPDAI